MSTTLSLIIVEDNGVQHTRSAQYTGTPQEPDEDIGKWMQDFISGTLKDLPPEVRHDPTIIGMLSNRYFSMMIDSVTMRHIRNLMSMIEAKVAQKGKAVH